MIGVFVVGHRLHRRIDLSGVRRGLEVCETPLF